MRDQLKAHIAAVQVEMGGGAMMRVMLPGGISITHELANEQDAQRQIKAALASLIPTLVTASNVGDDE